MYGAGGSRRSFAQNGGGASAAARQSLVDRHRNDGGGMGSQNRDSRTVHRPAAHGQPYDGGGDDDTDPSVLRRNTRYVNRESLYSFQQVKLVV